MKRLVILSAMLLLAIPAGARPNCASTTLTQLTRGLTFTTMMERRVRPFVYHDKAAKGFLQRVKALENRECQPWRTFDEEAEWLLDPWTDDKRQLKRLSALVAYMRANLVDLQTAFFGEEPEYEVYVFGRDKCGNVVGVRMVEVT